MSSLHVLILSVVACAWSCVGVAQAQITRDQAARLGVDVVLTRDGEELRGSVLSRTGDGGLVMAVRREWLSSQQPERLAREEQQEATTRIAAYEQLVNRIREWLLDVDDDSELAAILKRELEEFTGYVENPDSIPDHEPSGFLLLEVDANDLRRVFAQPTLRKQAALAAWQENLPNVEVSNFLELQAALNEHDVDWQNVRVDLSDRLPVTAMQSKQEWFARRAVYEFAFRNRIEFQGTGELVFRTDADADQPAMDQLLGGLLNGGLNLDLEQLLGGSVAGDPADRPDWRTMAIEGAEQAGAAGCRVTRVDTDLQNSQVSVDTLFLARVTEDEWETIWRHQETLDAKEEREALADRIRQDPQVAESLKLLESLGLKQGVEQAVQFGAATMEAQQTSDDRFFEFFDRYTQRLDGPPLRWSD